MLLPVRQVARYGRQREIRILVVVIYAQVYGQCYRRIVAVFRIDELARGTTGPPVVQVVGIHSAQSHVHGRERAHGDVVGRDFVHGAVVGILCRDAHCGTLSQYLDKRRAPHVTPLQVSHEVEIQRLVAHGTEQCGVAEDERRRHPLSREMLRPPKAVECADTGISKKLNTELLSWACDAAASRIYNAKISFFVIWNEFCGQRYGFSEISDYIAQLIPYGDTVMQI